MALCRSIRRPVISAGGGSDLIWTARTATHWAWAELNQVEIAPALAALG